MRGRETGVVVRDLDAVCALPYRTRNHQGFNFIFAANTWTGDPRIAEPELFDGCGWFPTAALPDPHPDWLTDALAAGPGNWLTELTYP